MDNDKRSEVEKALEELFNEPFIEIDNTKEENESISTTHEPLDTNDVFEDNNDVKYEDSTSKISSEKEFENNSTISEIDENIENLKNETIGIETDEKALKNPIIVDDDTSSNEVNKKGLIYILVFIFVLVVITAIILYITNSEKIITCTYNANDKGYKIIDEYVLVHKSNNLTYIQGEYIYEALNDEYKEQLSFVKEDKMPVIINSNGMPGFTHVYEAGDSYIKVYSYYDMTEIDFKKVDKINQKTTPVSYLKLKSTTTYKNLKTKLEKDGYVCKKNN